MPPPVVVDPAVTIHATVVMPVIVAFSVAGRTDRFAVSRVNRGG
jgi:hypothetical protein